MRWGKGKQVMCSAGRQIGRILVRLTVHRTRIQPAVIIGAFVAQQKENKKRDQCLFSLISFCGGVVTCIYSFIPFFLFLGERESPSLLSPLFPCSAQCLHISLDHPLFVPPPFFFCSLHLFLTTRTCISRNVQYFELFCFLKNYSPHTCLAKKVFCKSPLRTLFEMPTRAPPPPPYTHKHLPPFLKIQKIQTDGCLPFLFDFGRIRGV